MPIAIRSTVPLYICRHARFVGSAERLENIDWSGIEAVELSDTVTGNKPKEPTKVKVCWSSEHLYIRFDCQDSWVVSDFTERDEPLYEQDVVEVFLDEEGAGLSYMELEVSPNNVVFDAIVRNNGKDTILDLDTAWNMEGLQTSVAEETEGHIQYSFIIPFSNFNAIPRPGTQWRVNFYRIDEDRGGRREYQAWGTTEAVQFHMPTCFGVLEFQ